MDDSTIAARLAAVVGVADQWHEYDWLPGSPLAAGYTDRESQLAYIQSCFDKGNANANFPDVTPLDRIVENVCTLYQDATPKQRPLVRPSLPQNASFVLQHFAWRMAVRALRERSRQTLRLGLTAVVIEDAKFDFRDTLRSLAIVHHVAMNIQIDPVELFQEAVAISTERTGADYLVVPSSRRRIKIHFQVFSSRRLGRVRSDAGERDREHEKG